MATLVLDALVEDTIIEQRRRCNGDRHDEVWDGIYIMLPLADLEHQRLVGAFTSALQTVVSEAGLGIVYPGANVTDRQDDWKSNFRCPDVVVVLNESSKRCQARGAALLGGPDFLIEVQSPGDATLDKLDFYGSIGVRELLVVDRDTKAIELFRRQRRALRSVGCSPDSLKSRVVPLQFRKMRTRKIEVTTTRAPQARWVV